MSERDLSPEYVDPYTKQPIKTPNDYPTPKIAAVDVVCNDSAMQSLGVLFRDGRSTSYDWATIQRLVEAESQGPSGHAGGGGLLQTSEVPMLPAHRPWTGKTLGALQVESYADVVAPEESQGGGQPALRRLLRALLVEGIVLIKNVPRTEGECSKMASVISTLRSTEWGTVFNVRTVADTKSDGVAVGGAAKRDLAYSPNSIRMHTDNPYRYPTPDIQLLHAIEHCSCGPQPGSSFPCDECSVVNSFVDGFAIADRLRADEFDLLSTVPVRFENNGGDGSSVLWHVSPHLEQRHSLAGASCGSSECLHAVRFSSKSGGYAPSHLGPEKLGAFYAARRRFAEMAHDPSLGIQMQLEPGDMVIFNNNRILHARSSVAPTDGERFLQGCYANADGVRLNFEKLRRRSGAAVGSTPLGAAAMSPTESCAASDEGPAPPTWRSLEEATKEDYDRMGREYREHVDAALPETLLAMMRAQRGAFLGQPVDLLEHGLQTATRAERSGESVDVVVASLLHDVTETLAAKNHGETIAAILTPFVEPDALWMLRHHEVFQGFYYFHYFGGDRFARDRLLTDPSAYTSDLFDADRAASSGVGVGAGSLRVLERRWNMTKHWCHVYDQASFDPSFVSEPLEHFEPALRQVLSRQPYWWDSTNPKRAAVTG